MRIVCARGAKTSWLVALLVCFVSLGHACELPISAVVLPHSHGAEQDVPHEHSGESEVACDAVAGVRPSSASVSGADHARDAAAVPPVARSVVGGPAVALVPAEPPDGSRRPPLFLLHRSLLI
jgi:hypothetical protein